MFYRVAAFVAAAGVLTAAAFAAATPVTPPPGAVVTTSHPVFMWTLPSNEQSDALYIAAKPDTTPGGKFYDENVVDAGFFFSNERQWSPTSPLYAGALLVAGLVARREHLPELLQRPGRIQDSYGAHAPAGQDVSVPVPSLARHQRAVESECPRVDRQGQAPSPWPDHLGES
jgi:hypothetical protein